MDFITEKPSGNMLNYDIRMVDQLLDTFGKRLRILRMDMGLTQTQLANELQKIGVKAGQNYISDMERADRVPAGEVVAGLARALHTTSDYLLMLTDDPMPQQASDMHIVIETRSRSERALLEDLVEAVRDLPEDNQQLIWDAVELVRKASRSRTSRGQQ